MVYCLRGLGRSCASRNQDHVLRFRHRLRRCCSARCYSNRHLPSTPRIRCNANGNGSAHGVATLCHLHSYGNGTIQVMQCKPWQNALLSCTSNMFGHDAAWADGPMSQAKLPMLSASASTASLPLTLVLMRVCPPAPSQYECLNWLRTGYDRIKKMGYVSRR